jgi:hypothetical protein
MLGHLGSLSVLVLLRLPAAPPAVEVSAAEFFEKEVRPLLVENCGKCHGDTKPKGGLRLTSRAALLDGGNNGPAVVSGQPDDSLLIRAVRYHDSPRMPPQGKLTERQIETLTRWVAMGIPWPSDSPARGEVRIAEAQRHFWSFQPVRAVQPPAVRNEAWPRSPIDRFILARLEAEQLSPSPPADKRTLLRRVTFDLTGLPPTPEEIDAFLADDSPDAFARVVDQLLASPRYGERWGRHWLDVVRYADARDLIQLPIESDFREAWRYRDWVVAAFNRDIPYTAFLTRQIAGDLLQPRDPGHIDPDALVATGLLALADFVPGDTDKEMMIADYVNDQIDVVGRAFLGLTLACARCHDHKFDPISTRDYYALAGIFFSTRLVPAATEGNTPLVRVPLLAPAEISRLEAQRAADAQRLAQLERLLAGAGDREYLAHLRRQIQAQTARHLVAAGEYKHQTSSGARVSLAAFARERNLDPGLLAGWLDYLGRDLAQLPPEQRLAILARQMRDAAAGQLERAALERAARDLEQALAEVAARRVAVAARHPEQQALAEAEVLRFRADDPRLSVDTEGRVRLLPDRSGLPADAAPPPKTLGPQKITAKVRDHARPVLRFSGSEVLEARRIAPPAGSLFVVFRNAATARPGQRLLGWEDSDVGRHGLGLMTDAAGHLHAIVRDNGKIGDVSAPSRGADFEMVSLTWGPRGVAVYRDGKPAGTNGAIQALSSDPAIQALRIGGPGSGGSPRFQGDLAELRVYDRPLNDAERLQVEAELLSAWFKPTASGATPPDPLAELYDELISPRGPFWPRTADRTALLPAEARARLVAQRQERDTLKNRPAFQLPQAVVVQDGGPKGTRHEGFRDTRVCIRGDPRKLGPTVPRGFPQVLAGSRPKPITQGSGRLQLAAWLARPDHPLTARVLVNRVWQQHFGEGIVRTANNFGERGERPTHPELLDYLAARFVESGWSIKALHRLILLSAVYQEDSRPSALTLAKDPENRLFGRMNRRRLEAEAIRDSLLAVAGRLDPKPGGPAFADLAVPRRTLYLMSVRTGDKTSGFAGLFDRPDPGAIVEKRGVSTVAPQALFLLNDPFPAAQAQALAARVAREAPQSAAARIARLYALLFCRPPTRTEVEVGLKLLAPAEGIETWERYCHLLLCTNEFLYVD